MGMKPEYEGGIHDELLSRYVDATHSYSALVMEFAENSMRPNIRVLIRGALADCQAARAKYRRGRSLTGTKSAGLIRRLRKGYDRAEYSG
jgi:hypothetical protein